MKKVLLVLLYVLIISNYTIKVSAQLKVKPTGKVIVGTERPTDDSGNVLSMQVMGNGGGGYYPGGKIAFGDFGSLGGYAYNVFIGENGDSDSDQLQLHGKNGLYFTTGGQAESLLFAIENYLITANTDLSVWGNISSWGVQLYSDARLKTNISKIETPLTKLKELDGVKYNLA